MKAKRGSDSSWPTAKAFVPDWLHNRFGLPVSPNPLSARDPKLATSPRLVPDERLGAIPGLTEARTAAFFYELDRGASDEYGPADGSVSETEMIKESDPESVSETEMIKESDRDLALRRYSKSVQAKLAATRADLVPSEQKERLARFVHAFRRFNEWQVPDKPAPPGADMPLEAALLLAWWYGYWPKPPNVNSVRALRRLLERHPAPVGHRWYLLPEISAPSRR